MNRSFQSRIYEQGAALIIGLVLMMVLTLLAVSTMRTSTLALAMAGNAQYHAQATQLAETGIKDALERINSEIIFLNAADDWQESFSAVVEIPGGGSDLGRYDVTVSFIESGSAPAGSSQEVIEAHYFEIESTGRSAARNAKSTLRQGFYRRTGT